MVLILSHELDESTNEVMRYLEPHTEIIRWNREDLIKGVVLKINDSEESLKIFSKEGKQVCFSDVKFLWCRSGNFNFQIPFSSKVKNSEIIAKAVGKEWENIRMLLHDQFKSENEFTSFFQKEIHNNKLEDLIRAKSLGLKIPSTIITTEKIILQKFLEEYPLAVTKAIKNSISVSDEKYNYISGSSKMLNKNDLQRLDDTFMPVLVQEYIEKEVELRVFHLNQENFAMAIFSQLDEQTKIDYRNYNRAKPNRNVPFILPDEINRKINLFMKKSELDFGSIDLIYSTKNEYVFLEVNPVGQFGWVSGNCNYYLEEKIAKYILNEKKANKNYRPRND